MAVVVALIAAVAALFGGIIAGMLGAMGVLFGTVLLAVASVVFMVIPAL